MNKGNIIILNGVSSSGKTTLAKTLQERLLEPYFHMDVDVFCNMAPAKFNIVDSSIQWEFVINMFEVVKLYSNMGFNLIVPCIFWYDELLEKCVNSLHSYPVLLVHVKCNMEELRRREIERGNRPAGMAEGLLKILRPKDTYDITVDTYNDSLEKCAAKIIEMMSYPDKFSALKTLWSQYTR